MLSLLSACNTINIKPNEIHNSEFFLDARFSITITENNSNNSNLQNNYQGNLIFIKNNNDSFDVKILSPLNTMLAEIKSNKNNACLYKNSDNQNNLIPEYCDQNIDLLVNYFLQNNSAIRSWFSIWHRTNSSKTTGNSTFSACFNCFFIFKARFS